MHKFIVIFALKGQGFETVGIYDTETLCYFKYILKTETCIH